jgi:hypothetical protein
MLEGGEGNRLRPLTNYFPSIAPHLEFVDFPTEKTDTFSVAPLTVEGGVS